MEVVTAGDTEVIEEATVVVDLVDTEEDMEEASEVAMEDTEGASDMEVSYKD